MVDAGFHCGLIWEALGFPATWQLGSETEYPQTERGQESKRDHKLTQAEAAP